VGMQTTRIHTSIIGIQGTFRAITSIIRHTFGILIRVLVDRLIGNLTPIQLALICGYFQPLLSVQDPANLQGSNAL